MVKLRLFELSLSNSISFEAGLAKEAMIPGYA
jgi:hypothetical protein